MRAAKRAFPERIFPWPLAGDCKRSAGGGEGGVDFCGALYLQRTFRIAQFS